MGEARVVGLICVRADHPREKIGGSKIHTIRGVLRGSMYTVELMMVAMFEKDEMRNFERGRSRNWEEKVYVYPLHRISETVSDDY